MSTTVQFRRGTALQNQQFRGAAGEITIDMDNFQLRVHDGVNYGGHVISGATQAVNLPTISVNADGGNTGMFFSGGPVTNGTLTLYGSLLPTSGGTGTTNPVATASAPLSITGTWPNTNIALTGTVTVATGGTGISTTPGQNQVLLGDGSKYNLTTIRAGTGVNFDQTNPGVLTINSSGGSGSGTNVTLADLPPGTIQWFAMPAAPSGWLECDGRLLSKVTGGRLYEALWTAIGYVYNQQTDGTADNFRIPDLRGQFLRGWDHGAGVDPGRMFGNVQTDDFKNHAHNFNEFIQSSFDSTGGAGIVGIDSGGGTLSGPRSGGVLAIGGTETRPKNVAMLACIKFTSGAAATLVSNVNVTSGFAALTFSGGPVTTSGIIQLNTNGGSNTTFLRGDGTWASVPAPVIPAQFSYIKAFTTNTSWVVPAGVTAIRALVIGGGGGAGFSGCGTNGPNMPGGWGGYAEGVYTVTPGQSLAITIGSAGSSPNSQGVAGTGSSLAGTGIAVSATGGAGGYFVYGPNQGYAGANGVGTGGTLWNTHMGLPYTNAAYRSFPWDGGYMGYGRRSDAMASNMTGGVIVIEYMQ